MTRSSLAALFVLGLTVGCGTGQPAGDDLAGPVRLAHVEVHRAEPGVIEVRFTSGGRGWIVSGLAPPSGRGPGEGVRTSATMEGPPGAPRRLSAIEMDSDGDVVSITRGLVHLPRTPDQREQQLTSPVGYLGDTQELTLFWEPVPGVAEWSVYREGRQIGTATGTHHTLPHDGGTDLTYSLRSTTSATEFRRYGDTTPTTSPVPAATVDIGVGVEDLPRPAETDLPPAELLQGRDGSDG